MVEVLRSPLLSGVPGVRHAFFTRRGGVSKGLYASLNVGLGSGDDPEAVAENRSRVTAEFGVEPPALQTAFQIHSATALRIDSYPEPWEPRRKGDALVTDLPTVVCGVLSADCAPVLLVDPVARVVASVHAGWKGALHGIIEMALSGMLQDFDANPSRILAAVGPCIGPDSYEVGEDLFERFQDEALDIGRFFREGRGPGKRLFDLPGFVIDRLRRSGVEQAEWIGRDTLAEPELFFSNRRAHLNGEPDYGRLMSAIMLER